MQKIIAISSLAIIVLLGTVMIHSKSLHEHRARAFAHAAENGEVWKMRLLRLTGADPSDPTPGMAPALIEAAESGKLNAVQYLLNSGVDINQRDKFGYTPLIAASSNGRLGMVEYLLNQQADPTIVSEDGSALHIAAQHGRVEVMTLLKKHGVPDLDSRYMTPITIRRGQ